MEIARDPIVIGHDHYLSPAAAARLQHGSAAALEDRTPQPGDIAMWVEPGNDNAVAVLCVEGLESAPLMACGQGGVVREVGSLEGWYLVGVVVPSIDTCQQVSIDGLTYGCRGNQGSCRRKR